MRNKDRNNNSSKTIDRIRDKNKKEIEEKEKTNEQMTEIAK